MAHAIKIRASELEFSLLTEALKINALTYEGHTNQNAVALLNKLEKYSRFIEDGEDSYYDLRFFESEGEMFIRQFIALSYHLKQIGGDVE